MLYGDDLFFQDITKARGQLDLLEQIRGLIPEVNITYATLSEYFRAVLSENRTYSVYEGDFYPYISHTTGYKRTWTGFYSSRPALKKKIFEAHSLVRAAELSAALINKSDFQAPDANTALHHDAITGTCKPWVSEDYFLRLSADISRSEQSLSDTYSILSSPALNTYHIPQPYRAFVLFNPVNWIRTELVSIDSHSAYAAVYDSTGTALPSQSVPGAPGVFKIYFAASLRALSFTTFFINEQTSACEDCSLPSVLSNSTEAISQFYTLVFHDGFLHKILTNHTEIVVDSLLVRYDSARSGAYMFRPMVFCK